MTKTLTDAKTIFTDYLRQDGKAEATIIAYSKDVEQMIDFVSQRGKAEVAEVETEDITAFKDDLRKKRYTGKSISRKLNSVKAFFRFLTGTGDLERSPAEIIAHPKHEPALPRILSKVEYRALRDSCRGDARMRAVVELLLQTGMRISELAYLQMTDLDMDRNLLLVRARNSQSSRKVPLNNAAKKALADYLKIRPRTREKTVFLTKTCRPFLVRNIRTALDRYFRLAGIVDAKVNDLRHTFIVEQLRAGTPLIYVSQLVGHKRITTTEKYLKLVDTPELSPNIQIEQL